ncbi:MAG: mce4C [Nocardia sp.]|uniref:MCE family protein n=1 Tax=Nocardia sp. TaxID=1821 RepID=UPI00262A4E0A|nr:MCE family protein [Nocardia sp.]MCU1643022.1 mce4C [Nocardia sp.]
MAQHKSFLERSKLRMGVVGTLLIIGALVLAFKFDSIPFIHRGASLHAEFADASGLAVGDAVQVAGVKIGKVRSIDLGSAKVDVTFDADGKNQKLGDETTATIKVQTVLGRRFIDLDPRGPGELRDGATIPLSRTTSGYDITRSLQEVTDKVAQTDKTNLAAALDQIGKVESQLPPSLNSSITGLGRLSNSIATRDDGIRKLLANTKDVSAIVSQRNGQVAALFDQGNSLFTALNTRATTIHRVLVQAKAVSDALTGVAQDNATTLKPTLDQLDSLINTLNKNYDNLNSALTGLQHFATQVGEAVGSGPFFGALLHNIIPANLAGQIPGSPGGPR